MSVSTQDIVDRYRGLALEWAALQDKPGYANRVFERHHAFYKEVRSLPEAQSALRALLDDPSPAVRMLAATHLLPIAPTEAEPVLLTLVDAGTIYGFDAKYVLLQFHEGKLNFDW